jgi:hypothetical protein
MTVKEQAVETARLDVLLQESRVCEAERALNEGFKKLKCEFETAVNKLREELEREKIKLDKEKTYLQLAKSDMERGFEQ